MILQIHCENRYFLDLLFKNPGTDLGLYFKPLKNGIIAGNAVSAYQYDVVFQDTKYSYLPEESNQLDFQSYCSPLSVLHICTDLFGHILKDRQAFYDQEISWLGITQGIADTTPCRIEIPTFYIHSSWYRDGQFLLSRYFEGITVQHLKGRNFHLTVTGKHVFEAFNLLNLVALFTHMTNEYGLFTFIDDSFAEKYVRILTNIEQVPYFIFYLYIKRTVKSNKQFQLVKPVMEAYLREQGITAELTFFGTQQDRLHFVTEQLDLNTAILDIGCGEFAYYKRMMNKGLKANYYAVDEEERFAKLGEAIANRYESENLFFFNKLEDFVSTEKVNIIMSEVIEHNTLPVARQLVQQALQYNFEQVLITTPNAAFNQFYFSDASMRHDDHHFELTPQEFKDMIQSCTENIKDSVSLCFKQIGDKLNSIQPTQACIIKRIPALNTTP